VDKLREKFTTGRTFREVGLKIVVTKDVVGVANGPPNSITGRKVNLFVVITTVVAVVAVVAMEAAVIIAVGTGVIVARTTIEKSLSTLLSNLLLNLIHCYRCRR
jgi:hypothetical protein